MMGSEPETTETQSQGASPYVCKARGWPKEQESLRRSRVTVRERKQRAQNMAARRVLRKAEAAYIEDE